MDNKDSVTDSELRGKAAKTPNATSNVDFSARDENALLGTTSDCSPTLPESSKRLQKGYRHSKSPVSSGQEAHTPNIPLQRPHPSNRGSGTSDNLNKDRPRRSLRHENTYSDTFKEVGSAPTSEAKNSGAAEQDSEDDSENSEEEEEEGEVDDDEDDDDYEEDLGDDSGDTDSETSLAEKPQRPPFPLVGEVSPVVERSSRKHKGASQASGPSTPTTIAVTEDSRGFFEAGGRDRMQLAPASYIDFSSSRLAPLTYTPVLQPEPSVNSGDFARSTHFFGQDANNMQARSSPTMRAGQNPSQLLSQPPHPHMSMVSLPQPYFEGMPYQQYGVLYPGAAREPPPAHQALNVGYEYHPGGLSSSEDARYRGIYGPPTVEEASILPNRGRPAAAESVESSREIRKRRSTTSSSRKKRRKHSKREGKKSPGTPASLSSSELRHSPRYENVLVAGELPSGGNMYAAGPTAGPSERHFYRMKAPQSPRRQTHKGKTHHSGSRSSDRTHNDSENEPTGTVPREGPGMWRERYERVAYYDNQGHPMQYMPVQAPYGGIYGPPMAIPAFQTIPEQPVTDQTQAKLEIIGDLLEMTRNWTTAELATKRRLVHFNRHQHGVVIRLTFEPLQQEDYRDGMTVISCIWRRETNEYFVTSVDCITVLELIVGQRFNIEEKNRTRRNLEACRPVTVTKNRPELAPFFRQIMAFEEPRPRNIEKDLKVFAWSNLENALKKIVSKYSAVSPHSQPHP